MKAVARWPKDVANVLRQYSQSGGVVEHVLMVDDDGTPAPMDVRHRQAALVTLQTLQTRRKVENRGIRKLFKDAPLWQLTYSEAALAGDRIAVETFLGPYVEPQSRRLYVRGNHSGFLNHYFLAGNQECQQNAVVMNGAPEGYAYAFSEPPYRMQLHPPELQKLFLEVIAIVLGGLTDRAVIYQWSPDCSNFFDVGKDWWGAFFWTLERGDGTFVGIAASTSD